jgi:hypothetical protein
MGNRSQFGWRSWDVEYLQKAEGLAALLAAFVVLGYRNTLPTN